MSVGGLSITFLALGMFVAMPLAGALADKLGARRILAAGTVLAAVATVGITFVDTTWQAYAGSFLLGLADGGAAATLMTVLAQATPSVGRPGAFAIRYTLGNAAAGLGAAVGGFVLDVARPGTFTVTFFAAAGAFVVFVLVLVALGLSDGPAVAANDAATARTASTAPDCGETPGDSGVGRRRSVRRGYRAVLSDRVFLRALGFVAVLMIAGGMQLMAAFPGYVTATHHSARAVGLATSANTLAVVLLQLPALRLLRGKRKTSALALACGLWGASWMIILLGGHLAGTVSTTVFVVALVVFALGEITYAPSMPTLVNDLARDDLRGRYNGAYGMADGFGATIGPALAGVALAAGHATLLLVGLATICLAGVGMALGLERYLPPAISRITMDETRDSTEPSPDPVLS
jgi:MFS family permease